MGWSTNDEQMIRELQNCQGLPRLHMDEAAKAKLLAAIHAGPSGQTQQCARQSNVVSLVTFPFLAVGALIKIMLANDDVTRDIPRTMLYAYR